MAINRDKILREAEKLVQKGRIEHAIREYEKLLKANPNDANTINRVGDLYGRIGQVDRAIEMYERIADHFTEDGFTTKAIAILKKINRLAPQRLDVFARLAELYLQQGLVVEAKGQYQILAEWYLKSGDVEASVEAHRKLVQLDPQNHMANLRLADLLVQRGEVDDAAAVYDRLGRMLLERDKVEEAERLYRHALEQGPIGGGLIAPLVERQLDAGRNDAARSALDTALERSPDSQVLRGMDVRLRLATGDSVEAMRIAQELVASRPDDRDLRLEVGRALLASGEAVAARNMMAPVVEQLVGSGDYVGAQKVAQELLQRMSQDQRVLEVAVRAYRPSNDRQTLATLSAALADSCFRSGATDAARRLYVELLEVEPGNQLFRQRLSQLEGATSAPAGAVPDTGGDQPEVVEFTIEDEPAAPSVAEPAAAAFDPQERLAEANVFAKYGLVDKAIQHLEQILEAFPDHRQAREKLVAMYVEEGREDDAAQVAMPLARHYLATGDEAGLASLRSVVSRLDVDAPAASVPPPTERAAAEEDGELVLEIDVDELVEEGHATFDLPGEEVAYEESAGAYGSGSEFVELDEPEVVQYDLDDAVGDASPDEIEPLDAPIELVEEIEPETPVEPEQESPAVGDTGSVRSQLDELEALLLGQVRSGPHASPPPPDLGDEDGTEELVEISDAFGGPPIGELQQLDLFVQQELYEDAVRILERLEADHPRSQDLAERRLRLKSKGVLLDDVPAATEAPEDLFADEDDYIDLAAELEQELAAEEAMVDEATGRGQDEALLEEVFREFQKGVAEQLSEEDSDTHFNLGIAYKEMGLLGEAIREFQISSRDPDYLVESCSMIGVCYIEQGMPDRAAEWYEKALASSLLGPEASQALRYDLAASLEMAGDPVRAVGLFEQIYAADASYRDVAARLDELGEYRQAN